MIPNKRRKYNSSYGNNNLQDLILASYTNNFSNLDQVNNSNDDYLSNLDQANNTNHDNVSNLYHEYNGNDNNYDEIEVYEEVVEDPNIHKSSSLEFNKFVENFGTENMYNAEALHRVKNPELFSLDNEKQYNIHQFEDDFGIELDEWIINRLAKSYIDNSNKLPGDALTPVLPLKNDDGDDKMNHVGDSRFNLNKINLCQEISDVCNASTIKYNQLESILNVVKKYAPEINLPLNKNGNLTINKYLDQNIGSNSSHFLEIDVCVNECFVYATSDKLECENCQKPRFFPCSQCNDDQTACKHRRLPYKTLYYRSLGFLFEELLRTSYFPKLVEYNRNRMFRYMDIIDGSTARKNLMEMNQQFINAQRYFNLGPSSKHQSLTEMSLLISMFYDGAQIFKHRVADFKPLMISILNLPPNYRYKAGLGSHIVSIYSGEKDSSAEIFLFRDLFIQELLDLSCGKTIEVGETSYYLQVRLISVVMDTRELEHTCKLQSSTSSAGCSLCTAGKGVSRQKHLNKCYIPNHRCILPLNHPTRYFGQSQRCCESEYYTPTLGTNEKFDEIVKEVTHKSLSNYKSPEPFKIISDNDHVCCTNEQLKSIVIPSGRRRNELQLLHHPHGFSLEMFSSNLWYHHYDFRVLNPYRKNNSYYVNTVKNKDLDDGVKGMWEFGRLHYMSLHENLEWDPFHAFKNVCSNLIESMTNTRSNTAGVRKYCEITKCHPYLYTPLPKKKSDTMNYNNNNRKKIFHHNDENQNKEENVKYERPPWAIPNDHFEVLDAYIECINIPSGCTGEFHCSFPFTRMGNLKGVGVMQFFTVLINFIIAFSNMYLKPEYCNFYRMFGFDLRILLQVGFDELEELEEVHYLICETASIHAGIFPESESILCWHQLVHLASYISKMGPIRGWWALPGERYIGWLKSFIPKGGTKYDRTAFRRCSKQENARLHAFYDRDIYCINSEDKRYDKEELYEKENESEDDDKGSDDNYDNYDEEDIEYNNYKSNDNGDNILDVDTDETNKIHSKTYYKILRDVRKCMIVIDGEDDRRNGFLRKNDKLLYYDEFLTKIVMYGVEVLKISRQEEFEINGLLLALITYIHQSASTFNSAFNNSPLFRLYISFIYHSNNFNSLNRNRKDSFSHYLDKLYDRWILPDQNFVCTDNYKVNTITKYDDYKGHYYKTDFETLKDLIDIKSKKRHFVTSKRAIVNGVEMMGRGVNFREKYEMILLPTLRYGEQQRVYAPSNKENVLKNNWSTKDNLKSWCSFLYNDEFLKLSNSSSYLLREHIFKNDGYDNKLKTFYGQINFFFEISIAGDKIINQLLLSSVTCRQSDDNRPDRYINSYLTSISADDNISLQSNTIFISAININPTRYLTCGILSQYIQKEKQMIPIYIHPKRVLNKKYQRHVVTKDYSERISYLILLPLEPWNLKITRRIIYRNEDY